MVPTKLSKVFSVYYRNSPKGNRIYPAIKTRRDFRRHGFQNLSRHKENTYTRYKGNQKIK